MIDEVPLTKSNIIQVWGVSSNIKIDLKLPFTQRKNNNILFGRIYNVYYNNYMKDVVVRIKNLDNGFSTSTNTNEFGEYLFQNIDPGRYKISAEIRGVISFFNFINIGKRLIHSFNFRLCIKFPK